MNAGACGRLERTSVDAHVDEQEIRLIINRHYSNCDGLIAVLEEIQTSYGYLPESALRMVADITGRSMVDIYGVATFYRSFSLQPRGRHHICVCMGTACHVRGGPMVAEALERQLGIKAGETTVDGEFTLETVNCLGACALGPIVVADGVYHSKVDAAAAKKLVENLEAEQEQPESEPAAAVSSL